MIRRPPRSTLSSSSAASDVYKRQEFPRVIPVFGTGFSRDTHPFATHSCDPKVECVRLACVRPAASVRPEPGSNSPSKSQVGTAEALLTVESLVRQLPKVLPTRVWGRTGHQSRPTWHRAMVVDRSRPPLSVLSAIEIVQGLSSDDSRSSGGQPALAFSSSIPFSRSTRRPEASRHTPNTQA